MTLEPYAGRRQLNELYYITHIDNVPSILTRGILSHSRIVSENVPFTPIYNAEIVSSRRNRKTPDRKSLWDYANLYFQPRNAMLYQVICTRDHEEIALIAAERDLISRPNVFVSTGNAASPTSEIAAGAPRGSPAVSRLTPNNARSLLTSCNAVKKRRSSPLGAVSN